MKPLNRALLAKCLDGDQDAAVPRHKARPGSRATHSGSEPATRSYMVHIQGALPVCRQAGGVPIHAWTNQVEQSALTQLEAMSRLPCLDPRGLAVMPDVHVGNGACVGSVAPLRGALVPGIIGVDIGCGMLAARLDMLAADLPDSLAALRGAIEDAVPLGPRDHRETVDPAAWAALEPRYRAIVHKQPRVYQRAAPHQLGTLGGGNHFIEVCLDEADGVWLMLHSGSRGPGSLIGKRFIEAADRWCSSEGLRRPNRSLAWLPEGTPLFEDYREAMLWAQDYARANREVMLALVLGVMRRLFGRRARVLGEVVSCHHNYAAREEHGGHPLWVMRKGAIRAGLGELGIVPGSMGTESFIVRGLGNAQSWCSCAHGAGRRMSRLDARQSFSTRDLARQTAGIECRKDAGVVDEAPGAYKPIREVMANQKSLVEPLHTLHQVLCIKG